MRANIKPDKNLKLRMAQETYDHYAECLNDTTAGFIIAACKYFKLGKKRANDFVSFLEETSKEFNELSKDGILNEKLVESLKALGIDPNRVYVPPEDVSLQIQANKKAKESAVSIKEAEEMRRKQEAFKALLKGDTSGQELFLLH